MNRISVLGPLNLDVLTVGQSPDNWKENLNWAATADISLSTAGSVGYTIQDFSKLGNDVTVFANLGNDDIGHIIKRQLRRSGVNTDLIKTIKGFKTAIGVYWLMHGSRKRPLAYMMAEYQPWANDITDGEKKELLDCDLLHCGGYLHYSSMYFGATTELYKDAKERGILTSIDTQFPLETITSPWISSLKDILQYTDILIIDIDEAYGITGEKEIDDCIDKLMRTGIQILIIKMGIEGAIAFSKGKKYFHEAVIMGELVDSIGAGDAFGAGFLTQYLKSNCIEESLEFASVVAGVTVTGAGGSTKMPSYDEALALIKKRREGNEN